MAEDSNSLEFTPTWVVAVVCFVIVLISFIAQRGLHKLGKFLKNKNKDQDHDALCEALEKLKEELMLLGFISLLLTVFQDAISHICIPSYLASHMLPCNKETVSHTNDFVRAKNIRRQLLSSDSGSNHCSKVGKAPFLSLEAMHQLHIFIFVLAVVHVIFCAITMVLGGARLLLLVGAKLDHIITRMAQDVKILQEARAQDVEADKVKPSDEYFWFGRPGIVLDLIHFILFQNAFEIAFFVWIWSDGSISLQLQHLAPMGSVKTTLEGSKRIGGEDSNASKTQMQKMTRESYKHVQVAEEIVVIEAATQLPFVAERPMMSP
ncbi:hypothetical protein Q3G72_027317 [Acer saccharum]|nr:hypothetical protein Q3G72_027317 [Acer saccharum]